MRTGLRAGVARLCAAFALAAGPDGGAYHAPRPRQWVPRIRHHPQVCQPGCPGRVPHVAGVSGVESTRDGVDRSERAHRGTDRAGKLVHLAWRFLARLAEMEDGGGHLPGSVSDRAALELDPRAADSGLAA